MKNVLFFAKNGLKRQKPRKKKQKFLNLNRYFANKAGAGNEKGNYFGDDFIFTGCVLGRRRGR
jgi:regulator of sirC expression with transglutaminase-like and TPR domain